MKIFYLYDYSGWFAGSTSESSERTTDIEPANLSVSTSAGEMRANWTGYEWVDRPFVLTPEPSFLVVPSSITRRQAIQQLIVEGLDDDVQAIITDIPNAVQRKLMQAWYDESQVFERNRLEIMQVWQALGRTPKQLDDMFIAAANLK